MKKQEIYRRAANGEGQIVSYRWQTHNPSARVQILHDMGDHAGRYEALAEELTTAGYEVVANDLAGHGMSKQGHRGAFADRDESLQFVLEDIDSLYAYAEERYGELPRVLIGAGLGELLAEVYAMKYRDVAILVLIGPIAKPTGVPAIRVSMAQFIRRHGHSAVSPSVHNMMFQTGRKAGTEGDGNYYWLSTIQEEIRKYLQDEDCGFMLSASSYREML
ncbi:MAG: alpha/beta hydrolase, partial [Mogibacterium sp.]|nr:alpha/beta hydrolase [Mogibacterium sp.]